MAFSAAVYAVAVVVGGEGGAVGENARDAVLGMEVVEVMRGRGAEALADGARGAEGGGRQWMGRWRRERW